MTDDLLNRCIAQLEVALARNPGADVSRVVPYLDALRAERRRRDTEGRWG